MLDSMTDTHSPAIFASLTTDVAGPKGDAQPCNIGAETECHPLDAEKELKKPIEERNPQMHQAQKVILLRVILSVTLISILPVSSARATCSPSAALGSIPPPGSIVVCSGETINQNIEPGLISGYGTRSQSSLIILIPSGASVSGSGANFASGIDIDRDNIIKNFGFVSGTNVGIVINSGSIINSGTILSDNAAIATNDTDSSSLTVNNTGEIRGSNIGIYAASLDLRNEGSITATTLGNNSSAILVGRDGHIINFGTLSGGNYGILVMPISQLPGESTEIENYGRIDGAVAGIEFNTSAVRQTVRNFGEIDGGIIGIVATNANIINAGTIQGQIVGIGGNNISVTNSGTIVGGGYGISIGTVGTIYNTGTISGSHQSINSGDGISIYNHGLVWGDIETLNQFGRATYMQNFGVFSGSIDFRGINNSLVNEQSGFISSGPQIDLGSSGRFENRGTINPGGMGHITTTNVIGSFTQTQSGRYSIDVASNASDRILVSGPAMISGSVDINLLSFNSPVVTSRIFTAAGGLTDNGITAPDTAAVDYTLLFPDANTMTVQGTINFQGVGLDKLSPNQNSVGGNLNTLLGGGTSLTFLSALAQLPTGEQLANALDQLGPLGDGGSFSTAMATSATFAGQLLSCRNLGEGDANAFIREGQCLWVRANVRTTDSDGGSNNIGFDENATLYSAGGQVDIGGPWRLGAGIGFETSDLATESNARSESDRLHLGAVVKYNSGPLLLAAGITAGHGWADNERRVSFGGFSATAVSDTDLSFITGRLTAAYLIPDDHWYAKPQVDLTLTQLERDAYSETGAGGIALDVDKSSDTVFSISPSLEIGAQYALAAGGVARPYVKAGLTWTDQASFLTSASFAGAPASLAGFAVETEVDNLTADLGAGVDFISESGTVLRLNYDSRFGDTTDQHAGGAKLSLPF